MLPKTKIDRIFSFMMTSMITMQFFVEIMLILKAIKSHLKGHLTESYSRCHFIIMKFIKLVTGLFNKFHMK